MAATIWDRRFLDLARLQATYSKDPRTQVGAVIVDERKCIVGLGYNGFPRGVADYPERYSTREIKHMMVVHAEVNAVINAVKSVYGCTLYTTCFPCPTCAGVIIQAGIGKVVTVPSEHDQRYPDRRSVAETMFAEAGVFTEELRDV